MISNIFPWHHRNTVWYVAKIKKCKDFILIWRKPSKVVAASFLRISMREVVRDQNTKKKTHKKKKCINLK